MHIAFYKPENGKFINHRRQAWDYERTVAAVMEIRMARSMGRRYPSDLLLAWDDRGPSEYFGLFDLTDGEFFPKEGFMEDLENKVKAFHSIYVNPDKERGRQ